MSVKFFFLSSFLPSFVEAAATIRQHPFILSAHVNLCYVGVGCLSRSVAVLLNICSKLVRNTTFFFRENFSDVAWFPTFVRHTLKVRGVKWPGYNCEHPPHLAPRLKKV
jgi:hypothetical protein